MKAWTLGTRTLIAATCYKCGGLFPGDKFGRHYRNVKDKKPYIDHRCTNCKWGAKRKGGWDE